MCSGEEATFGAVGAGGTEPAARGGRAGRLEIPGGAEGAAREGGEAEGESGVTGRASKGGYSNKMVLTPALSSEFT